MKKIILIAGILTASIASATQIAVIDTQKIIESCKSLVKVIEELKKQEVIYEKKFAEKQKKLEKEHKQLSSTLSVLPPQKQEEKKQEFDARVDSANKEAQDVREKLQAIYQKMLSFLRQKVNEVLETIHKGKFDVILDKAAVVWAKEGFAPDITDKISEELNKNSEIPADIKQDLSSLQKNG